jgi:hypothetical protein
MAAAYSEPGLQGVDMRWYGLGVFSVAALGLVIFGSVSTTCADTIQVPGDQPTIQAGLNAAGPGDSVVVAAGIYVENIIWPEVNGIKLIGQGRESTIIDGNDAASVIRFEAAQIIDNSTILEGFTIQGGNALPPWPESEGGGVFLYYADPILRDLTIQDNVADDFGGGVYAWQSSPLLVRVVIAHNSAISRGGIVADGRAPHLDHVTIADNDNGGLYVNSYGGTLLENCIVSGNDTYGVQISGNSFSPASADAAYSDLDDPVQLIGYATLHDLGGNIEANPLFIDPAGRDYHLTEGSPCIDAGDPNYPLDPDHTRTDMGAFYFMQSSGVDPIDLAFPSLTLESARPNPLRTTTRIGFDLPQPVPVSVAVVDASGRLVKSLLSNAPCDRGRHWLTWNGRDASGQPVAAGVYYYRLQAASRSMTRRLVVAR